MAWQLIYFDSPTRGEQLRLLFKLAEVEFVEDQIDFPGGLNKFKRDALGKNSPLMFDQCPAVRAPNGAWVSQTAACMQFVGRSLSLAPSDECQNARALALTLGSEDLRDTTFYKLLIPGIVCKALTIRFYGLFCCLIPIIRWWFGTSNVSSRILPAKLAYFENQLSDNNTDYFCGQSPTYADVAIFDCVRETLAIPLVDSERIYSQCPKLKAFISRMGDIPSLKGYIEERGGYAIDILLKKHALPAERGDSQPKVKASDDLYSSLIN